MANGEQGSKLIDNLTSLPLVSSSITTFKSNPYGAKSLDLTHETYAKISPYIKPYAQKPYDTYLSPYVQKADSLASDGLTKVEKQFPIVTEEPSVIKSTILDFAFTPLRLASSGRDYLLETYGTEYKKCGGDGAVAGTKALLTTGLVVTSDALAWVSALLSQTRDQSRDFASAKYQQAQSYASQASRFANEKKGEALQYAQDKGEQAKSYAYTTGAEARDGVVKAKEAGERKAGQAKAKAEGN